ncbi:hypothetical protein Tco_0718444, partial [Tanacetum coccineum]
VMAFFVISISSDSSEESVGTSTARVILFGTIPTTIPLTTPTIDLPVIHDDTLLTPTISPTLPPVAPTIQYTSPFIDTDLFDSETPDSPPSQDPYETIIAQWTSRVATRSSPPSSPICHILPAPPGLPCRPVVLVLPGQLIPIGRPYRTQPDGVLKMLTARRVLDHYLPIDLHRDTHKIPLHQILLRDILLRVMPYQRLLVIRRLLLLRGHLGRYVGPLTNLEVSLEDGYEPYVPREVGLGVDIEDSYEPYTEPAIDYDILVDIDECIAYAD